MTWTKRHSLNAVAAKSRKRIERAEAIPPQEPRRKVRVTRMKAKWRIQIADLERGETLTLRLYSLPWPGRFIDAEHHERSTRQICETVRLLLNQ